MNFLSIAYSSSSFFSGLQEGNTGDSLATKAMIFIVILAITVIFIFFSGYVIKKIMARRQQTDTVISLTRIFEFLFRILIILTGLAFILYYVFKINIFMWQPDIPRPIDWLFNKTLSLIIIFLVTFIFIKLATSAMRGVMVRQRGKGAENSSLTVLFTNLIKYGSIFISGLTVLDNVFEINISAILATAGIASVAIGFGAQSLVQDIITGIFLLLENYYSVGDLITLDGYIGKVEYLGIRSTKIRTFSGDLYNVPNGHIKTVLNHARGDRNIYLDIPVAYERTLEEIISVLKPVFAEAPNNIKSLSSSPEVLGISKFADSCMIVKVQASCKEGLQYSAERELLGLIKKTFDANGIKIPYNKLIVLNPKEEN